MSDERFESHWPFHHRHHHKAPLSAPTLAGITFILKDSSMAPIVGTTLQQVTLTLTLPTTRTDGSAAALTEIQSATINRDSGSGPVALTTIGAPFATGTVQFIDTSPATGNDIYTFFATDTAGTVGATSLPASVTIVGSPLAPLSAGTITASAGTAMGGAEVISPASVSLAPGAQQAFTASPAGVTWSALSGTIDSTGLYTAPATAGTDTITATSTTTSTSTGTATVTIAAVGPQAARKGP